ncbi:BREX protein BrxB domain-containing protein [Priestia megaterium]|uniref:BREX protein BrxB domain-containing protein n=1 Tax=Priestia megaterium TaxID=1404 RepID=UPI0028773C97|nr:BREX protein BrxB domain-containing protein [Priestia megaterium]
MSKVNKLIRSYKTYIAIPWRMDTPAAQRVIFCIYNENDELRLRAKIDEFEITTREYGHEWALYDLTNTFAEWISKQRYAQNYFQKPHLLSTLLPNYLDYIVKDFEEFIQKNEIDNNTVVAVKGVSSLFGFLKVRDVVDRMAPLFKGRLLIFFPGSYENNVYKLLDGYDSWNYMAVPITPDRIY